MDNAARELCKVERNGGAVREGAVPGGRNTHGDGGALAQTLGVGRFVLDGSKVGHHTDVERDVQENSAVEGDAVTGAARLGLVLVLVLLPWGCQRETAQKPASGQQPLEAPAHVSPDVIKAGDTVRVVVKKAPVKVGKRVLTRAEFAAVLVAEKVEGAWVRVTVDANGKRMRGWVHSSALVKVAGENSPSVWVRREIELLNARIRRLESGANDRPGQAKAIEAESFTLRGADGTVRANLSCGDADTSFVMFDKEGVARAYLGLLGGNPLLRLNDARGKPRVELVATKDGTELAIGDGKGEPQARLVVGDKMCGIEIMSPTGKASIRARASETGSVLTLGNGTDQTGVVLVAEREEQGISLQNAQGKVRAVFRLSGAEPGLILYGDTGQQRLVLTTTKETQGLALHDAYGSIRAAFAETKAGACLMFTDTEGKTIWSAPR